ncbi:hypothetical protein FAIPA1_60108 [Frankia sp. AiPs1]
MAAQVGLQQRDQRIHPVQTATQPIERLLLRSVTLLLPIRAAARRRPAGQRGWPSPSRQRRDQDLASLCQVGVREVSLHEPSHLDDVERVFDYTGLVERVAILTRPWRGARSRREIAPRGEDRVPGGCPLSARLGPRVACPGGAGRLRRVLFVCRIRRHSAAGVSGQTRVLAPGCAR